MYIFFNIALYNNFYTIFILKEYNSPPPKKKEDGQGAKKENALKKGIDVGSAAAAAGSSHKKIGDDDHIPPFLLSKACIISLPTSCKELYFLYKGKDIDFNIKVDFEEDTFYYPNKERFLTSVCGYDLRQLLNMEWLNKSILHIWIRYKLIISS